MSKTIRAGLGLWPLLWIACGSSPSVPTPEPSAPAGPPAYLVSLVTETWRDSVLRTTAIGADGRLGASHDLPLATTPAGPMVDAERGFVFTLENDRVGEGETAYQRVLVRYRLDPLTGALLPFGRAAFGVATRYPASNVSIHPNGRFLYSGGAAGDELDGFRIETGPSLAVERLPQSPLTSRGAHGFPSIGAPRVSPSGRFAWSGASVIYKTQGLVSFRVSPDTGALDVVGTLGLYDGESNMVVDPRERFAFQVAGGFARRWWTYGIDPDSGALFEAGDSEPLRAVYAYRLLIVPSGRWLIASDGETVRSLEVTADGRLALRHELALDHDDVRLAFREGMIYVGSRGRLRALRLDETTGALEVLQELPVAREVVSMTVLPVRRGPPAL